MRKGKEKSKKEQKMRKWMDKGRKEGKEGAPGPHGAAIFTMQLSARRMSRLRKHGGRGRNLNSLLYPACP